MNFWQNSTPFFGAAAFCRTKIDDFRAQGSHVLYLIFCNKIFLASHYLNLNFFDSYFLDQHVLNQNFFDPKMFWVKEVLKQIFFGTFFNEFFLLFQKLIFSLIYF